MSISTSKSGSGRFAGKCPEHDFPGDHMKSKFVNSACQHLVEPRRAAIDSYLRRNWAAAVLCTAILLTVLFSPLTQAQTFRGTILGTVTDATGAAIGGATVVVKNADTGLTRT